MFPRNVRASSVSVILCQKMFAAKHWLVCRVPSKKRGFPGGSDSKESACSVGDLDSVPRSERSPGEGTGNSLQYSCWKNPTDRGIWRAIVHGVAKNQTRLSD